MTRNAISILLISAGITLFGLFRLLVGNILYINDTLRVQEGYGWHDLGRPVATWFLQILGFSRFILDISPASQIIAILLICVTGYLIGQHMLPPKSGRTIRIAFILIISLNPYILQIYSFRYESLPYAVGFLLAASAYLVSWRDAHILLRVFLSTLLLTSGALIYQATLSVYLVLFLAGSLLAIIEYQSDRPLVKLISIQTAILLFASVCAKLAGNHMTQKSDVGLIKTRGHINPESLPMDLYNNINKAITIIHTQWIEPFNIVGFSTSLVLVAAVLLIFLSLFLSVRNSQRGGFAETTRVAAVVVLIFAIFIFSPLGVASILEYPGTQPRLMSVVGIGIACLLAIGLRCYCSLNKNLGPVSSMSWSFFACWPLFVFSLVFGNALAAQTQYQDRIYKELASDLYIAVLATPKEIENQLSFIGTIRWTKQVPVVLRNTFPILENLVYRLPKRSSPPAGYWRLQLEGIQIPWDEKNYLKTPSHQKSCDNLVKRLHYSLCSNPDGGLVVRFR